MRVLIEMSEPAPPPPNEATKVRSCDPRPQNHQPVPRGSGKKGTKLFSLEGAFV